MEPKIRYIDRQTLQEFKDQGIGIVELVNRSQSENTRDSDFDIEVEIHIRDYDIPF